MLIALLLPMRGVTIGDVIGNLLILPFIPGVTSSISFTYQSLTSGTLDLKVILNDNSDQNLILHQSQRPIDREVITLSFIISGQLKIYPNSRLMIQALKNGKTVVKEVRISPIDHLIYYPHLQGTTYQSFASIAKIDNLGQISQIREVIDFIAFDEVVEQLYGLRFPLELFKIRHNLQSLGYPLADREGELYIDDPDNLFPRLPKVGYSTWRRLSLRYEFNEGFYHLVYDYPLYVDKQTRMMSVKPDAGFHLTNQLYFPINQFEKTKLLQFQIRLGDVGINHNDIDYSATLYSQHRYIGDGISGVYTVEVDTTVGDDSSTLKEVILHE